MNPLACHAFQKYSHLIDDEMYNSLFSNKNRVHCSICLLIGGLDSKMSGVQSLDNVYSFDQILAAEIKD